MVEDPAAPRVAAITGASSGVGAAVAEGFAAQGWKVAIGARRVDRLASLAGKLGPEVLAHPLDVGDPASVDAFCAAVEERFGVVDLLVNNAGVSTPGRIGAVAPATIEAIVRTNLTGTILMTNRVVRSLREQGRGGDVLFVSSDAAADRLPLVATYAATKAGMEHFARNLKVELEGTGIRLGTIRIGQTATEFTAGWSQNELDELFSEWQRVGALREFGLLQGAEVARAAVSMASAPANLLIDFLEVRAMPPVGGTARADVVTADTARS